jgi:trigger factor
LIHKNLETALQEKSLVPVSRLEISSDEVASGADFACSLSFEVMPKFSLPPHEGLCLEQKQASVDEPEVDAAMERLRERKAEFVSLEEERLPMDGDLVKVDFEAFDGSGAPLADVSGRDMSVFLGRNRTLAGFEALIKTLKVGESGEGPVAFPEDYFHKDLAGKTVTMKILLTEIAWRKLPDLDDAFARESGNFDSLEELRQGIRDEHLKARAAAYKAEAKNKLLDSLLESVDFPLPEAMLENNLAVVAAEMRRRLEQFGQNIDGFVQDPKKDLREEARPEALRRTRAQILLLSIAREHDLEVGEGELSLQLHRMAMQDERSYSEAMAAYGKNERLRQIVHERLLEDKALDFVYDKAVITMIPPESGEVIPPAPAGGADGETLPSREEGPAEEAG